MAEFTVELRTIVESGYNIFNFPYEFYDETRRAKFEQDFIRHFYFREIGCATVDRFVHYLNDKMQTVFPFYNELFKTAMLEYSKLENYDMRESTTVTRDTVGKSSGISSTVGQAFDNRETDTTDSSTGTGSSSQHDSGTSSTTHDGTSETVGTGKETTAATGTSDTTATGSTETTKAETVSTDKDETTTTDSSKTGTSSTDRDVTSSKKVLNTPQGLVDLSDSRFVTSVDLDTTDEDITTTTSETADQTVKATGTVDVDTDSTSTTDSTDTSSTETESNSTTDSESNTDTTVHDQTDITTTADQEGSTTVQQDSTGKETTHGEQRTTEDNNTRATTEGSEKVVTEHYRHGNIGVQTATDMLEKHIDLQKKLSKILLMFFDECEDLFMGVYC